ncbi:DNA-3-methyladenine glycosylase [Dioscorea cayenensis subsp. rotundata]|uniref:DNA-3-methyladenine glycosylase II n=1 Tax=Dioscorea cayennensis subsp. rotundata TaxID=55577 RepID=A0AB40BKF8_DIOCR|nr:DNA-3-methyladenine glycosylase [Dioscorea cayenensis subsp. rotundata]
MAAALGSHVAPPLRPSPMKTSSIAPPSFKRTPKKKTTTTTNKKKQSSRAVDHHSTPLLITPVPTNPSPAPILPPEFFLVDALDLAPRLLGKLLRRDEVVLRITEVEAYRPNDTACHGRFGLTARTAPVFGAGGHAYVYLCYGLHMMLNIVADEEGVGAAVLIRSCSPVNGLKTIQERRGQNTVKPVLLTGPGKVGQALGLTTAWSHHPLYTPGGLEVLDGPEPENILVGPRVGIEYASPEHVSAPWRFAIAGSPWISSPRNTLRPP